jgi:hypothetical protein
LRRAALVAELVLSLALVGSLGVAAWKLARVLDRLEAGGPAALGFGLVFAAAAVFAGRKALAAARRLKGSGNEDDAISRRR